MQQKQNNQERWTLDQYKEYKNKSVTRSKYGARKTAIDGHTFDSEKEANYYEELKLQLRGGHIEGFCIQPVFILAPGLKYKADFIIFHIDRTHEIIDVKRI